MKDQLIEKVIKANKENNISETKLFSLAIELDCLPEDIERWRKKAESNIFILREILDSWKSRNEIKNYTIKNIAKAFTNIDCKFFAELLEKSTEQRLSLMIGVAEDSNFIGRTESLKVLQNWFDDKEKCIAITGSKGIGKTKLVMQHLLNLSGKTNIDCAIINSESLSELRKSLEKLLKSVPNTSQLNINKINTFKMFKLIVKSLTSSNLFENFIFVFDNLEKEVEKEFAIIDSYLNEKVHAIDLRIIITTRYLKFTSTKKCTLQVDSFSMDECVALLSKNIENQSMDDMKKLSELLDCFPLLIQQAIIFIRQEKRTSSYGQMYGIQNYLEHFKDNLRVCLDHKINLNDKHDITFYQIIIQTLNKINGEFYSSFEKVEALNICLQTLCYISTDELDIRIFKNLIPFGSKKKTETFLTDIFAELKSYSLIKIECEKISIRRVHQNVLQNYFQSNKDTFLFKIIEKFDMEELKSCNINHFISLIDHITIKNNTNVIKIKTIISNVLDKLVNIPMFYEAEFFYNKYLPIMVNELGDTDVDVLDMQLLFSKILREIGGDLRKLRNSYIILLDALRKAPNCKKFEHKFLQCIAGIFYYEENYTEALSWFKDTLKIRNNLDICTKRVIAHTRSNIANCLERMNRYKESEQELIWVINWQINELKERSDDDLKMDLQRTRHSLGHCLYSQKKYSEALKIFDSAISITLKFPEKYHCRTLPMRFMLGKTKYSLGNREEAVELLSNLAVDQIKYYNREENQDIDKTNNLIKQINKELANNCRVIVNKYISSPETNIFLSDSNSTIMLAASCNDPISQHYVADITKTMDNETIRTCSPENLCLNRSIQQTQQSSQLRFQIGEQQEIIKVANETITLILDRFSNYNNV